VRLLEGIAAATKPLGQILSEMARLRAELLAGLDRLQARADEVLEMLCQRTRVRRRQ
jgi:hypothetical protein